MLLARILDANVEFTSQRFRTPMRLSSGLIETITEARARVRVSCNGSEAEGQGSIYLSDLWAWPDPALSHDHRDAVLRERCERLAGELPSFLTATAHPLELGLQIHHAALTGEGPMPLLARSLCAAPFDAALHDAVGRALRISAFDFYNEPQPIPSADEFFPNGAIRAIAQTLRGPVSELPAWWIVNAHDDLNGDLATAVKERSFRCFKIKLLGHDVESDAARTVAVYQAARKHGAENPTLSVDSNEANPDAASVLEYLHLLKSTDQDAFDALGYLEQPTSRDIERAAYDWKPISAIKPVFLDEGLTGLDTLPLARTQGWSGLALKTCKGHSFTLVAAAWAHAHGLLLTMQDLTNPGIAALHSFQMASRLPVINGIELNSPQFTPQANAAFLPKLAALFEPRDGIHRLAGPFVGLGLL